MEKPTLPAARLFADEIGALYAKGLEETALWQQIASAMRKLLADPTLKQRAQSWPMTVEGAPTVRNLLFYEDPDYGFVFNATVRKPNVISNVHDHGDVWTLYGLNEAVRPCPATSARTAAHRILGRPSSSLSVGIRSDPAISTSCRPGKSIKSMPALTAASHSSCVHGDRERSSSANTIRPPDRSRSTMGHSKWCRRWRSFDLASLDAAKRSHRRCPTPIAGALVTETYAAE